MDVRIQERKKKKKKREDFAIVSLDESFLFYDSLVRHVWIDKDKRPIVRVTGSHEYSCLFGAMSMKGRKQLFRQYDKFNGDTFLDFLKKIHHKFSKCYIFMDKALPRYKSMNVRITLKRTGIPLFQYIFLQCCPCL